MGFWMRVSPLLFNADHREQTCGHMTASRKPLLTYCCISHHDNNQNVFPLRLKQTSRNEWGKTQISTLSIPLTHTERSYQTRSQVQILWNPQAAFLFIIFSDSSFDFFSLQLRPLKLSVWLFKQLAALLTNCLMLMWLLLPVPIYFFLFILVQLLLRERSLWKGFRF